MKTEKQYLKAKDVIKEYEHQLCIHRDMHNERLKKEQQKREDSCEEHDYIDASYKWGNPNRMRCIHCCKIID